MIRKSNDSDIYEAELDAWDQNSDRTSKMRRVPRSNMPVGACVSSNRGFHKTRASRQVFQ